VCVCVSECQYVCVLRARVCVSVCCVRVRVCARVRVIVCECEFVFV